VPIRVPTLLAISAAILTAAAGWAYYALVRSPDAAIRHAEAFLFRRMARATAGQYAPYRFFYATNRSADVGGEDPLESFGRERDDALSFGRFDAVIEPSVGLGMLLDPTDWFQNEEIKLRQVRGLEQGRFVEEVAAAVAASPEKSLLILVHGFRDAFPSALRKTAFVSHILDIDTPVLVFDWPGNQGSSLSGYRRARDAAVASGPDFARALDVVSREVRPERLWIVANSMGGQVVAEAFRALYEDPSWADADTEFEEVVLTAPDVSREEFDEHFGPMMRALTRHLTVYVSSNDRALVLSRLVNRERRLGESSLGPNQLEAARHVARLLDNDETVTLVDVTPVNRTRNFHNFSLETPEFFDDLYLRIVDAERAPLSRLLYPRETPDGRIYWVLTRGR